MQGPEPRIHGSKLVGSGWLPTAGSSTSHPKGLGRDDLRARDQRGMGLTEPAPCNAILSTPRGTFCGVLAFFAEKFETFCVGSYVHKTPVVRRR